MLVAQAVADAVLDPMALNALPAQFTASTIVVWVIDALKRSNWFSFMSKDTGRINQVAAVIGAMVTSAGIHFGLEPSSSAGTYSFVITGLSLAALAHFVSGTFVSLASQQTLLKAYQVTNVLRDIAAKLDKP